MSDEQKQAAWLADRAIYRASPMGQAWAKYWKETALAEQIWWASKEEAKRVYELSLKQADQTYQEAILPMEIVLEETLCLLNPLYVEFFRRDRRPSLESLPGG